MSYEAAPGVRGWVSNDTIEERLADLESNTEFEENYFKPKKYKLKDCGLILKHKTSKAFLFEVKDDSLPKKCQKALIWIPAYCLIDFKYINEQYIYKLVFKITKTTKIIHNVLDNPEQYKGKTAKQIYNIVSKDIPNITDLGFSKSQIYYTVQKTETVEMSFLDYINKYFKGNK